MQRTDEEKEFISLLENIHVRIKNKRSCDEFLELGDKEVEIILSLRHTKTMTDACKILKPLYQKYKGSKGKRNMPEMIIRGIYFIIFREQSRMLYVDGEKNPKERKLLSDDGKLRKRILPQCTNEVYKLLGEKNSKAQERLGIRPLKDFTMFHYEPVDFHFGISKKDQWFRALFLNVMYDADNPFFIDLSGEDSVLGDIYYCDREVLCCSNSVTANFYYVLQLRYKEFYRRTVQIIQSSKGNLEETIAEYKSILESRNMQNIDELAREDKERMVKLSESDHNYPIIPTYPLQYDDIDIDLAAQYLVVAINKNYNRTTSQLQEDIKKIFNNQIQWLRLRIKDTIISWCSIKEMLSKINNGNISFLHLKMVKGESKARIVQRPDFTNPNSKHYTYFENLDNTIEREKEELKKELAIGGLKEEEQRSRLDDYEKNKEKRIKKGFLFYDYDVCQRDEEAEVFIHFVKENDCQWAFVCEREDNYWWERLKAKHVNRIEINLNNPYASHFPIYSYRDVIIITNVNVRGIVVDRIKNLLNTFDKNDSRLINNFVTVHRFSETECEIAEDTDEEGQSI